MKIAMINPTIIPIVTPIIRALLYIYASFGELVFLVMDIILLRWHYVNYILHKSIIISVLLFYCSRRVNSKPRVPGQMPQLGRLNSFIGAEAIFFC